MLAALSTTQLVSLHNLFADKPVNKFTTKTVAQERVTRVLTAQGVTVEAALAKLQGMSAPVPAFVAPVAPVEAAKAPEVVVAPPAKKASPVSDLVDAFDLEPSIGSAPALAPVPSKAQAKKDAKPKKVSGELGLSGTKLALLGMMKRPNGVSEAEGCAALNWAKCTATILRVIELAEAAGMTARKWKEDKKTRYAVASADVKQKLAA